MPSKASGKAVHPGPLGEDAEGWLVRWLAARPEIDSVGIAILGRLIRLGPAFEAYRNEGLEALALSPEISDLIISLLRSGPPYQLNTGRLSHESTFPLSTSGGMTYRVDCAERLGLVKRQRDTKDRRGVIVALTKKGLEAANRDVDMHMELVARFLEEFSDGERREFARLLKKLLTALGS